MRSYDFSTLPAELPLFRRYWNTQQDLGAPFNITAEPYANINSTGIPIPPTHMARLFGNDEHVTDRGFTIDLIALGLSQIQSRLKFWSVTNAENNYDYVWVSAGGNSEGWSNNTSWTERTYTFTAPSAQVFYRKDGSASVGADSAYLALLRIEQLVSPGYQVNDMVSHNGALYAATVAGTQQEPGTGSDWVLLSAS